MKIARPVYRYGMWIGQKSCCQREKALSQDDMHKCHVRTKRNRNHLPSSWDTKFIKRQKSWKHRVKKKKQWMSHIFSVGEWEGIRGLSWW